LVSRGAIKREGFFWVMLIPPWNTVALFSSMIPEIHQALYGFAMLRPSLVPWVNRDSSAKIHLWFKEESGRNRKKWNREKGDCDIKREEEMNKWLKEWGSREEERRGSGKYGR
jgi:hypothetical protein